MRLSDGTSEVAEPLTPHAGPPPQRRSLRGVVASLTGTLPTLVVLAGAAAVGWWGHHADWRLPKFSELRGVAPVQDDWCAEHNVPESACVECDAALMPKAKPRGWCKVHGVPERTLHHPELAQLAATPVVTADDLGRAKRALDFAARPANNPNCRTHLRRIQYATAADAD